MDLLLDASRRRNWQAKMTALRVPVWWCAACIPAVRYAHTLYARRRRITAAFSGVKSVFTRDGKRARLKMKWDVVGTRVESNVLCFFAAAWTIISSGRYHEPPAKRKKVSRTIWGIFPRISWEKNKVVFFPFWINQDLEEKNTHTLEDTYTHARVQSSSSEKIPPPQ